MRVIQFEIPNQGRRLGVVEGQSVYDATSVKAEWIRVIDVFRSAEASGARLEDLLADVVQSAGIATHDYDALLGARVGGDVPFLHPPVDAEDPHQVLITGTGLTHLGSMKSRDSMHSVEKQVEQNNLTDSAKMFQMGIEGGKPQPGERGVAPEWFYKGNGTNLCGHRWTIDLPAFAGDGGEEAELVGCYVIDSRGTPRRLGFALGNEWSDHVTERINYLYLAPSKLRQCAVGPELITDFDFQELKLNCKVLRKNKVIYDSGELFSGEEYMCHSLANCEDHHFKYPQHRHPGDVHLHYFGTSKLSHTSRDWKYQAGDEITVTAENFGAPLVNIVQAGDPELSQPVTVKPA